MSLFNDVLTSSKTSIEKDLTEETIYDFDKEDSIDSSILESYKGVYPMDEVLVDGEQGINCDDATITGAE